MSFLLRLLKVLLLALLGGRRGLLDKSVLSLRVWPNDLDLNIHMNNGRYLTLMDLGRLDLMMRTGALGLWLGKGWQPLVGTSMCRHFKSLNAFQKFELHTRLLGWDDKWVFFEQRYVRRGKLYCLAAVKGLMADARGPVPTAALFEALGQAPGPSPALPAYVQTWQRAEREAIERLKQEAE